MVKSMDLGWHAASGMSAALLAELGMTGHRDIVDGENGLWRALGYSSFDGGLLTHQLGERWYLLDASLKRWPCQYWIQPALTAFARVLDAEALAADEIDEVLLRTNSRCRSARFRDPQPRGAVSCQFNIPHPAAMLALRIVPGPRWFEPDAIDGARTRQFRAKVSVDVDPAAETAMEAGMDGVIRGLPGSVEVRARGRVYQESAEAGLGSPWFEGTRMSDDDLRLKVREMADVLIADDPAWEKRTELLADRVFALDELQNVGELTALLRP
jgi:2-methylcitrate dehydratase PrpD